VIGPQQNLLVQVLFFELTALYPKDAMHVWYAINTTLSVSASRLLGLAILSKKLEFCFFRGASSIGMQGAFGL